MKNFLKSFLKPSTVYKYYLFNKVREPKNHNLNKTKISLIVGKYFKRQHILYKTNISFIIDSLSMTTTKITVIQIG